MIAISRIADRNQENRRSACRGISDRLQGESAITFQENPHQLCDGLNNDCDDPLWPLLDDTNEDDRDGDSRSQCLGDCDDTNVEVWARPGEVDNVEMLRNTNTVVCGQTKQIFFSRDHFGKCPHGFPRSSIPIAATLATSAPAGEFVRAANGCAAPPCALVNMSGLRKYTTVLGTSIPARSTSVATLSVTCGSRLLMDD